MTALFRVLDRLLNEATQRRAPALLTDQIEHLLDRRDREGIPLWRTR